MDFKNILREVVRGKKQILFSLLFLFLMFSIVGVQAISFVPTSPNTLDITCGESKWIPIILNDVPPECPIVKLPNRFPSSLGLDGLFLAIENGDVLGSGFTLNILCSIDKNNCESGQENVTIDVCGTPYLLSINVGYNLIPLNEGIPFALAEGQKFSVGENIHFNLINVGYNFVEYSLEGCSSSETELYVGGVLEINCGTERLGVEIAEILGNEVATFDISFSTNIDLIKSDSDINNEIPTGCELGIDTLGATVKRGSVFAFNTIDINSGKYEPNVIVNILDQAGDLTPLSGTSDNTGFFQKRIHEDYKQDLLIKLFKDGCEPTNKVILFETSYDDYILTKQEEEGGFQLVLNMSERYEMKAISGTIKNLLNEVVEGVEVKITNPDNSIITVQSNVNGLFTWTPTIIGVYKLQGSKEEYGSTDLVSIEVYQNKQYLIVIKVNGEQKADYKKGDRISFELRDMNNTLIPLSIENATFAGLPLSFIAGISDEVIFEGTSGTLNIPAVEGYTIQSLTLTAKKNNWSGILMTIGIIVGILVVLILVVAIVRKFKGSKKPERKMEIQLGEGE